MTRVCGSCYLILRPTEYGLRGLRHVRGRHLRTHRVSRVEVDGYLDDAYGVSNDVRDPYKYDEATQKLLHL